LTTAISLVRLRGEALAKADPDLDEA